MKVAQYTAVERKAKSLTTYAEDLNALRFQQCAGIASKSCLAV